MDDTIREKIIKEFIARAAVIRTTGSPQLYATDIGARVLRARPKVDPDELPCTVVWPQAEEAKNADGLRLCRMPIRVEGLHFFGKEAVARVYASVVEDPSTVSERLLGDLLRCFVAPTWDRRRTIAGSPVTILAPYAESIVYQGGGADEYPEDGSVTVGASARFLVTYWTKIGDPCSQ